jgi:ArsR family transcriptional regulator
MNYEEQAARFKLLGHPVRLQILSILRQSPECVCHLEAALGRSQPYISQQLRVLREAGIIADQKEGLNVYYLLVDPKTATLLNAALGPVLPGPGRQRETLVGCSCPKCSPPILAEILLDEN